MNHGESRDVSQDVSQGVSRDVSRGTGPLYKQNEIKQKEILSNTNGRQFAAEVLKGCFLHSTKYDKDNEKKSENCLTSRFLCENIIFARKSG